MGVVLYEAGVLYGAHRRGWNCSLVLSLASAARDLYRTRDVNFLDFFTSVSAKMKSCLVSLYTNDRTSPVSGKRFGNQ
jgi:hypothetical protein